jgi:hypothetical protein
MCLSLTQSEMHLPHAMCPTVISTCHNVVAAVDILKVVTPQAVKSTRPLCWAVGYNLQEINHHNVVAAHVLPFSYA